MQIQSPNQSSNLIADFMVKMAGIASPSTIAAGNLAKKAIASVSTMGSLAKTNLASTKFDLIDKYGIKSAHGEQGTNSFGSYSRYVIGNTEVTEKTFYDYVMQKQEYQEQQSIKNGQTKKEAFNGYSASLACLIKRDPLDFNASFKDVFLPGLQAMPIKAIPLDATENGNQIYEAESVLRAVLQSSVGIAEKNKSFREFQKRFPERAAALWKDAAETFNVAYKGSKTSNLTVPSAVSA